MKKLAVFDLDGTLLDSKGNISEEHLHAIHKLRKNDYEVTIATGRPEILIREYVKKLGIKIPIITCNGAVVGNAISNQYLAASYIPKDKVRTIIDYCIDHKHLVMAYTNHAIYSDMNERVAFFMNRNQSLAEDEKVTFVLDIKKACSQDVFKLLIIERDLEKYTQIKKTFEKEDLLEVVQSNQAFLDIMPSGCSKKTGLECLQNHFGLSTLDLLAFGDQYNDIEMLQYAGVSVGMGNAVEAVKEIVDHVTLTNNENGIAYAVDHYILKQVNKCSKTPSRIDKCSAGG